MANRTFQQFSGAYEKGLVRLHATVAIGATGAPTLQAWNPATAAYATAATAGFGGVKSIARTNTGLYTITLQDSYQREIDFNVRFKLTGGTSNIVSVACNTTLTNVRSATAPAFAIACMSSTATVADPDSGSTMFVELWLQNSSAL